MPTAHGITVSLQSQYDALAIPEQALPPSLTSLDSANISIDGLNALNTIPPPSQRKVEVAIPTYPSSQFWISYSCPPPAPSSSKDEPGIRFYYFKLFANTDGPCILSWGVGEQDNWAGKTMFAPFHTGTDFEGKRVIEKKGLFFPSSSSASSSKVGDGFEIRIFRAKARKRIEVTYPAWDEIGRNTSAFDLTNIGRVKRGERQRMYTYALIDPKDEPFVTFKYHLRPLDASESTSGSESEVPSPQSHQSAEHNDAIPAQERHRNAKTIRRLSIPPKTILVPSTSRSEPSSPIKGPVLQHAQLDDNVDVDPGEQKRREWFSRTPSPMVSRLFDRPGTPPVQRKKAGSNQLLRDVVTSALKRRPGGRRE